MGNYQIGIGLARKKGNIFIKLSRIYYCILDVFSLCQEGFLGLFVRFLGCADGVNVKNDHICLKMSTNGPCTGSLKGS